MTAIDARPTQQPAEKIEDTPRVDFEAVTETLRAIRQWSPASRIYLAQRILDDIADETPPVQPREGSLEEFQALLQSDNPPSDEEVAQILGEARMERWNR